MTRVLVIYDVVWQYYMLLKGCGMFELLGCGEVKKYELSKIKQKNSIERKQKNCKNFRIIVALSCEEECVLGKMGGEAQAQVFGILP